MAIVMVDMVMDLTIAGLEAVTTQAGTLGTAGISPSILAITGAVILITILTTPMEMDGTRLTTIRGITTNGATIPGTHHTITIIRIMAITIPTTVDIGEEITGMTTAIMLG